MNIHAYLHEASRILRQSTNSDESKLEAKLLLEHVLKVNHAWLIAHAEDKLDPKSLIVVNELLERRIAGEPIAYILGEREFYGLNLKVTPDTLIPRPDTETLVESALAKIPQHHSTTILDLGTGSGAIALAIAKCRPQAKVTALDASINALAVAKENAMRLSISNIQFIHSNWFQALANQRYDMIVSNPPYIEDQDPHLSQGDLRFEPSSALVSGNDGLNAIRHIITNSKDHLNAHGWLIFEHGYNQATAVAQLLKKAEFKTVTHVKDLAGIERVTLGLM